MNLNGRKSLDPRWVDHNIPVVSGFMNATVLIQRKIATTQLTYDKDTKEYSSPFTEVFTGIARIQPYGINFDLDVGLDPTARRLVLVQIKGKNLGIITDDILTITATDNNTELMKYQFDVRGSIASSLTWATQLVCEADLKYGS
jgi:hypothetical protein